MDMWNDFLVSIGAAQPRIDSQGQLKKAQAKQTGATTKATPAQERAAREAGFPSYDAMIQFQRQKMKRHDGTITEGEARKKTPSNPAKAHPASIFQYVADILNKATGG